MEISSEKPANQQGKKNESELLEGYFLSIYLTIIALIQGIALALLVQRFVECFLKFALPPEVAVFLFMRYLFSALVVFAIWHHYMHGVTYLRWFPDWRDSLIPFSLGASELFVIYLSERPGYGWHLAVVFLAIFATLAYLNAAYRIESGLFCSRINEVSAAEHCKRVKKHQRNAAISCSAMAILAGTVYYVPCTEGEDVHFVLTVALPFCLLVHLIVYEIFWHQRIRAPFREFLRGHM